MQNEFYKGKTIDGNLSVTLAGTKGTKGLKC